MQMAQFYLICPIGFEKTLLREIELKKEFYFPNEQISEVLIEKGGVSLECELNLGLSFNLILKTPTRILLRVKEQVCRDYPKMYKILKKINWKQYLKQENITITASAKESRLIHTKRIEQTALKAVKDYFTANQIKKSLKLEGVKEQGLFIRLDKDKMTISLDTSGELLHLRSSLKFRGHGSIRETYASNLLLNLLEDKEYSNFSLIDPMCGTGTFIREAKNFLTLNKKEFSFSKWNIDFRPPQEVSKDFWGFKDYLAFDIDKEISQNVSDIKITTQDFFKSDFSSPSIMVINPPYGKRVQIKTNPIIFFETIVNKAFNDYQVKKLGIIIPKEFIGKLKPHKKILFNQNGIKVYFCIFTNL